jgi:hypothetical protein
MGTPPRVRDYSFGPVTVDGPEQTRDLIVLPDRVVAAGGGEKGHALVLDDLWEVLNALAERLIVGVAAYGRLHPDPAVVAELERRGVTVE